MIKENTALAKRSYFTGFNNPRWRRDIFIEFQGFKSQQSKGLSSEISDEDWCKNKGISQEEFQKIKKEFSK